MKSYTNACTTGNNYHVETYLIWLFIFVRWEKRIFQFYVFYVIFYGLYNFHQFIVMAVAICREPNVKFTYSALGNPNSNATIETNLHITVLHSTTNAQYAVRTKPN